MLLPIELLPGSETQWIFWPRTGARLRASQENSQSLVWLVVFFSGGKGERGVRVQGFFYSRRAGLLGGRAETSSLNSPPKLRRREGPARQGRVAVEHLNAPDPRHPSRDARAVFPHGPRELERHADLCLGAVLEPSACARGDGAAALRSGGAARCCSRCCWGWCCCAARVGAPAARASEAGGRRRWPQHDDPLRVLRFFRERRGEVETRPCFSNAITLGRGTRARGRRREGGLRHARMGIVLSRVVA